MYAIRSYYGFLAKPLQQPYPEACGEPGVEAVGRVVLQHLDAKAGDRLVAPQPADPELLPGQGQDQQLP